MKLRAHNRKFLFIVLLISLAGFLIRFTNITYSSLWADELYSMLSVHPGNSWYQILYLQRTYQPPLYFMVLWQWTKAFGYTEFAARLLSVVGGTAAIIISGYLGKVIKNNMAGIIMALLVAFNPTQILYSLEARFYIFAYCFAALSLMIYWVLIKKRPAGFLLYFVKAFIDATLCYFHHFGIVFVFAMFLFDIILLVNEQDKAAFWKKFGGYVLSALLYAPWFFWGLLQGMATKVFWLKEINIFKYFNFSLGLPTYINGVALVVIGYFLFRAVKQKKYLDLLFPFICFIVILIPLLYSVVRIPILVDRYSMVMAPAIYLMLTLGLLWLWQMLKGKKQILGTIFIVTALLLFSIDGFNISFINKRKLEKQPWRQMAVWLKKQPDYADVNVYSTGILLANRFTIDFYIEPGKKAIQFYDMKTGSDNKMYLVESSSVWKMKDSVMNKVQAMYQVKKIPFNSWSEDFGNIYVCTRKPVADSELSNVPK